MFTLEDNYSLLKRLVSWIYIGRYSYYVYNGTFLWRGLKSVHCRKFWSIYALTLQDPSLEKSHYPFINKILYFLLGIINKKTQNVSKVYQDNQCLHYLYSHYVNIIMMIKYKITKWKYLIKLYSFSTKTNY